MLLLADWLKTAPPAFIRPLEDAQRRNCAKLCGDYPGPRRWFVSSETADQGARGTYRPGAGSMAASAPERSSSAESSLGRTISKVAPPPG